MLMPVYYSFSLSKSSSLRTCKSLNSIKSLGLPTDLVSLCLSYSCIWSLKETGMFKILLSSSLSCIKTIFTRIVEWKVNPPNFSNFTLFTSRSSQNSLIFSSDKVMNTYTSNAFPIRSAYSDLNWVKASILVSLERGISMN
jgi:hypothetical protein